MSRIKIFVAAGVCLVLSVLAVFGRLLSEKAENTCECIRMITIAA